MDEDGYPTETELRYLEREDNVENLFHYLQKVWWDAEDSMKLNENNKSWRLELHTVGWSGNEDIINSLAKNLFFWQYWEKTERGGHYYFKGKKEGATNPPKGAVNGGK